MTAKLEDAAADYREALAKAKRTEQALTDAKDRVWALEREHGDAIEDVKDALRAVERYAAEGI
jgi:exonuclease VII small subunit